MFFPCALTSRCCLRYQHLCIKISSSAQCQLFLEVPFCCVDHTVSDLVNFIYYLKGGDMYVLEVPKRLPEAPLQAVKREILVECEEKRKVKP